MRSDDTDVRRAAFGALAQAYWRSSYHYLRLRWHLPAEDSEDAVQAFFDRLVIELETPAGVMPRPRTGVVPSTSKLLAVTRPTSTRTGSPSPVRFCCVVVQPATAVSGRASRR